MKFISISPTKDLRKSEIIDVEEIDMISCKLTTQVGVYNCEYPKWRVLMLLEQPDIEEQVAQTQSPIDRTNLWGAQHFVG